MLNARVANWVKACTRYKIQETLFNVGLHTQKH